MKRLLSMVILASFFSLSACKSKDEKAREFGFTDYSEQQDANAKGFKTKKELDEYVREEAKKRLVIISKMKQSSYCYFKGLKLRKFVMSLDSPTKTQKALMCENGLDLFFTHALNVESYKSKLKITEAEYSSITRPIYDKVESEFAGLAKNDVVTYGDARQWSEYFCTIDITDAAKEKSLFSTWCNPDTGMFLRLAE